MKIHSTKPHTGLQRSGARRFVAILGVALLSSATCAVASAQSGLFGGLASPRESRPTLGQQITHGSEAFRVVNASGFPTAADTDVRTASHFDDAENRSPTIQQVGLTKAHCRSCGTGCGGSCGRGYGGCGSCGTNCGGACGRNSNLSAYGNPCAPCIPYYYVMAEALYMDRDSNSGFSLSPNYNLRGGFDAEYGGRITIGAVPDCVYGYELTFTGNFEWDAAGALLDPGGGIQTFLNAELPLTPVDLSAFNDTVTASAQTYRADYWSVELNRILVGWDVAKLLYGARYIDYDERYNYISANATETGLFSSGTSNTMYGLQVGMDLLYPVSRNGYTDFRCRLGGMLNYSESRVSLINAGALKINNGDDTTDLAGVFELGGGLRYQLGQALSIRAGAELWYLTRVATAKEQFGAFVSPAFTGRRVSKSDDVLITGVSVGAELRF